MYFTIENPDMKVIEEIHRAKEISDNANEEKSMFLYNMTNEIRGITKDIDYSADNILEEVDNKKVDVLNIGNSAREIKNNTAKFTTMTNEILDISQMDSNIKIYNDKYNNLDCTWTTYSDYFDELKGNGYTKLYKNLFTEKYFRCF